MNRRHKNLFGALAPAIGFLMIFPGLDIAGFVLLHPSGFWQRAVYLGLATMLLWPTLLLAVAVGLAVAEICGS